MDSKELLEQVQNKDKWLRALYMVLFLLVICLMRTLLLAIILLQFILSLILNKPNENLVRFSKSLSFYIYQIYLFLTYNSEEKPYPFGDWPRDP